MAYAASRARRSELPYRVRPVAALPVCLRALTRSDLQFATPD